MAGATLASPTADAPPAAVVRRKHVSPGMEAWRRFRRHRMAVVGAVVLTLLICGVLFGPFFWPVSVSDIDFSAMLQGPSARSEEHTSELQSLMRISYAVFCLKKK